MHSRNKQVPWNKHGAHIGGLPLKMHLSHDLYFLLQLILSGKIFNSSTLINFLLMTSVTHNKHELFSLGTVFSRGLCFRLY